MTLNAAVVIALFASAAAPALAGDAATARANQGEIAYGAAGKIWVIGSDGSGAHAIADGDNPSWAPDGRVIVFQRPGVYGDLDLYITDADGRYQHRLVTHPGGDPPAPGDEREDFDPTWSPIDGVIVFASDRAGDDEIYTTNSIGHSLGRLTRSPGDDRAPAWSADGNSIAFVSNRDGNSEIYTMSSGGTDVKRLTGEPAQDDAPAWSPNGREIAFQTARDGNWEIYVMSSDGTGVRRLTSDPAADTNPSWSADGNRIVFTSDRAPSRKSSLFTMPVSGGTALLLSASAEAADKASWQPGVDFALKIQAPSEIAHGKPLRARITIRNTISSPAVRIAVTTVIRGAPRSVSTHAAGGRCTGSRVSVCSFPTVSSRGGTVIHVVVRPTRCGVVTVDAKVASLQIDLDPSSNRRRAKVRVAC